MDGMDKTVEAIDLLTQEGQNQGAPNANDSGTMGDVAGPTGNEGV